MPLPTPDSKSNVSSKNRPDPHLSGDYLLGCSRTDSGKISGFFQLKTDQHLLTTAPTRSDKGRAIIMPNLLNLPDHSVFVVDPKGENALVSAKFRRDELNNNILIFNPYRIFEKEFNDLGFTQFQNFNPLANLNPESPDFADDVANIAEALIYDETGGESHWVLAARGYVEFLIMFLVTDPEEQANKTVTLGRLRQILAGGYSSLIDKPESEDSEPKDSIENASTKR